MAFSRYAARFLSWVALLSFAGVGVAAPPVRSTPEHCVEHTEPESWSEAYRRGFRAIEREEYDRAERQMCRALLAARHFGPRDWRFAETLDELGLIAYQLRDLELAERLQGAAIAEMLLATGPAGEPLERAVSKQSPVRADCRSGVRTYTTRLGLILDRRPGRVSVVALREAPWRIFEAGYLPLDTALADRLEWLISRYLLEENLTAAEELARLRSEILGDTPDD